MIKLLTKKVFLVFTIGIMLVSLCACNNSNRINTFMVEPNNSVKSNNGYVQIEYGITSEGLIWNDKENMWVNPLSDGSYNLDTIRTGRTNNYDIINRLYEIANWEKYQVITDAYDNTEIGAYDYLDNDPKNPGILTVEFIDSIGNSSKIAMDKNGTMVLIKYYRVGERYEELAAEIYKQTLKKPDMVNDKPIIYNIPNDLYNQISEILFSLPCDSYEEDIENKSDTTYIEINEKKYYYSDINCDLVEMILLCDNLNIISADYNLNFTVEMGSDEYDDIWNIFKHIGEKERISPSRFNVNNEKHMIIITPDGYKDFNGLDGITIYGDNGVVKVSCKTDEIYFKVSENMLDSCEKISSMK